MHRRLLCLVFSAVALFFLATTYHLAGEKLTRLAGPSFSHPKANAPVPSPSPKENPTETSDAKHTVESSEPESKKEKPAENTEKPAKQVEILSKKDLDTYLDVIFDRKNSESKLEDLRLACRPINETRYKELKEWKHAVDRRPWYFALNLYQVQELLPQLMGSIVRAARYLGTENSALSIVEGNSKDATVQILEAMREGLKAENMQYYFESSDLSPNAEGADRIDILAELRNMALKPLLQDHKHFSANSTAVFINDVAICPNDILELMWQRIKLGAVQTCAMDWNYHDGKHPVFYDVWVTRTMQGDSFFHIPKDGSWDDAWHMFPNDTVTGKRFSEWRPFQVYSCWNGATAFSALPLMEGVRFRKFAGNECVQGEPQLFGKDLWLRGYGRIAVVPTINLDYKIENARRIKKDRGYTEDLINDKDPNDDLIEWQTTPPEKTLCQVGWHNQFWQSWNLDYENKTASDW
ncbi:hypothetical protein VHEMI08623 [[Torrubiella] hemipterigena]|uniref:Alpha-1,3-mannosyltransferase CMT1 n=1 Tax=[Torrubiella] hemipterigena TaxID=1531966 RepID=A0A0A1TQ10_9HYPO|nr:hypothetical protein VHEMI08623 [[Torrubiella] hemipterigena]